MKKLFGLLFAVVLLSVAVAQFESLAEGADDFPPFLHRSFLKVELWQWIGLLVVVLLCLLASMVGRSVARRVIAWRNQLAAQPLEERVALLIGRAVGLVSSSVLAIGLVPDLKLIPRYEADLAFLLQGAIVFGVTLFLYGMWDALSDTIANRAAGHERAERLLVPMMRKFVHAVIVIGAILTLIGIYGGAKAITTLLTTLGLGGLVIALAAKDSVENVFGSLTILFDMPFALGDWVRIDKTEGTVEEINLRSTRIRTAEDTLITLPNANLIRASVENFGSRRARRVKLLLRLSYDSKPDRIAAFTQGLHDWIEAQPEIDKGRTIVEVDEPTEASIGVTVQCFGSVNTLADEMHLKNEILLSAMRLRTENGIFFAPGPRPPEPTD